MEENWTRMDARAVRQNYLISIVEKVTDAIRGESLLHRVELHS